jgi:pyruvate dehydrogenase E1 component alpha subunit
MDTPAILVGSQALHATDYALGTKLDGSTSVAITISVTVR